MPNLYVIFHGAWAFVDNAAETCIHAYAADVPEHVYMGGSWLGERKILDGSTLSLSVGTRNCDTQATTPRMQDLVKSNTYVVFCKKTACPVGAYAEVRLPRPDEIIPQLDAGDVGLKKDVCDSSEIYLVPVFRYAFDFRLPANKIALTALPAGTPFWTADDVDHNGVTTLHLFAADDTDYRKDGGTDFEAVAALFGHKVHIKPSDNPLSAAARKTTIGDMKDREYEITTFLNERVDWLHYLGKNGKIPPPPPPPPFPLPFPPIPPGPIPQPTPGLSIAHEDKLSSGELSSCGGGGGGS